MTYRLTAALIALGLFVAPLTAQERAALVIGNSNYGQGLALANPINDAAAMSSALNDLDFKKVAKVRDADYDQMKAAILQFSGSLKKNSVALFFYAGHGVEINGENYLVPIDADLQNRSQIAKTCYKLETVMSVMDQSPAALKILILDCCRNDPFESNPDDRGRSIVTQAPTRSLGKASDGMIIAFSTAQGTTASDGKKRDTNSPFTKHLTAVLGTHPAEGLEIDRVLHLAAVKVKHEVGQVPWTHKDATVEPFYLRPPMHAVRLSEPTPMPVPPVMVTPRPTPMPQDWAAKIEAIDRQIKFAQATIPRIQAAIVQEQEARIPDQREIDELTRKSKENSERAEREKILNERARIEKKFAKLNQLKKELQDKYLEITAKNLERGRYERMMTAAK